MQVIAAGGLHVVGTERHESRRIDNQVFDVTPFVTVPLVVDSFILYLKM